MLLDLLLLFQIDHQFYCIVFITSIVVFGLIVTLQLATYIIENRLQLIVILNVVLKFQVDIELKYDRTIGTTSMVDLHFLRNDETNDYGDKDDHWCI